MKSVHRVVTGSVAMASAALLLSACSTGSSGEYPTRSISIIVPVPAGSGTDLATRLVVPCLEKELGQTIVVENRDGGSGAVGNGEFTRAKADGYTLVSTTAANAVLPEIIQGNVGFTAESFMPLGMLGQAPIVLVTAAGSDITADDILAGDDKTLLGIPGATSVPGIVLQSLVSDHDSTAQAVPFDGNNATIVALLNGEVDAALVSADNAVVQPRIDDGGITAIATALDEPMETMPDVPTLDSLGYADLPYANSFWFLAAQNDTPAEVSDVLAAAVEACMTDSTVKDQLGSGVAPDSFIDGDAVAELLAESEEGYAATLAETK